MSERPKPSLFEKATAFHTKAEEVGLNNLVSTREDGAIRITDYPITVESPNPSLIIGPENEILSGHNPEEIQRILGQVRSTLKRYENLKQNENPPLK